MRSFLAALLAFTSIATTQASAGQYVPPGQLNLGGLTAQCFNIPTVIEWIPDMGYARPGVIYLNPNLFNQPVALQRFVYAHECGHHVVGMDDAAADCWAIRIGRDQGWFRPEDFQWLVMTFQNSPGDWSHAPGPARLQNLAMCYNS